MERQTGIEHNQDQSTPELVEVGGGKVAFSSSRLSEEGAMVLDCLQRAGAGLTAKQIEARVSCSGPAVNEALEALLAENLIGRLNTLVPSYAVKHAAL